MLSMINSTQALLGFGCDATQIIKSIVEIAKMHIFFNIKTYNSALQAQRKAILRAEISNAILLFTYG